MQKSIRIPFDTELYINSQKTIWTYHYKKTERINIVNTIIGIVLLIEGFLFDNRKSFSLALTVGIAFMIYMFTAWLNILFKRIKVFKAINKSAARYEQEKLDCTFEFSDNFLVYKDNDKMFQMKWHTFSKVVTFKDNILLIAKYSNNALFTFSRLELGDEEYQEVYDILIERIK